MIIGVPCETYPGERRVALVPALVPALTKAGLEVWVERGAGESAGFPDALFQEKGARVVAERGELFGADLLLMVRAGGANAAKGADDLPRLREGQTLIAFLDPLSQPAPLTDLAKRGVNAFSIELMPRITRAQSMDALSSMATIAGYKAVLLAASTLPRMFPMMMTAAGTITAARVFVIGAGVAGLQAIASARRIGGVIRAYDVRAAVADQVRSVGAEFVELEVEAGDAEDKGGYAKAMDESFYRKQRELMAKVVAGSDVVITTAAIPGKAAPVLITEAMVKEMVPGSVIVDLAAERGGNCELSRADQTIEAHGVTILGPTNLPATVPYHASQLYAKNLTTFVAHLVKKGELTLNMDDEITRETLVTRGGEVVQSRVQKLLAPAPEPLAAEAE
jgi:proton-translocating NAD(P)+ transhydrogenase subunit alpha